jgi:hypothetical protein
VGKGDQHRRYAIHGDGIDSIRAGFDEIAMPSERRNEAVKIISEVLDANDVQEFRWYKTPGTDELCCRVIVSQDTAAGSLTSERSTLVKNRDLHETLRSAGAGAPANSGNGPVDSRHRVRGRHCGDGRTASVQTVKIFVLMLGVGALLAVNPLIGGVVLVILVLGRR